MIRRIIGNLIIVAIIFCVAMVLNREEQSASSTLDTPSPALGKMLATAVHQTLSDPYFTPLEKLTAYLDRYPGMSAVSVDMLTRWAPDDEFPTCFVWNTDGSRFQVDHDAERELVDVVIDHLENGLQKVNPNQLLYLNFIKYKGEKYWLGFIRIPLGSASPIQMAGVFFSIDRYIEREVPRLLADMINRPRFPLAAFQAESKLLNEKPDSHLSMRILKNNGEVYFQRGRTFEPDKLIYAESQYFSNPVVAMMEGWDLQVFSANVEPVPTGKSKKISWIIYISATILLSLVWWIGTNQLYRPVRINPEISHTAPRPGRGIRLDKSKKEPDESN